MRFKGGGVYWNTQEKGKFYEVNGEKKILGDDDYMRDVVHEHVVNFITEHREEPFYVYYSMSHVHTEILRTPDCTSESKDLYADNVIYMDKLVGKLVAELERLKLREKTLIVFFGDNGTAKGHADQAIIGGRRLAGQKGTMLEGGSLEPMIVNWPGMTPPNKISDDMIDSSDFFPTFAELAGAKLSENKIIDGINIVPQLRDEKGNPRESILIQLTNQWYVKEAGWKLNQARELFEMSDAPFVEKLVDTDTKDPIAIAARIRLHFALDKLNPSGGILDIGDGTGRHANKTKKKNKIK